MIFQLHHQHRDGHSDFVSQQELTGDIDYSKAVADWIKDVAQRHPLPFECMWLVCDETSDFFVRSAEESGGTES